MRFFPVAATAAAFLAGCASPNQTIRTRVDAQRTSYATEYLGAGGIVVSRESPARREQDSGFWKGDDVRGAPSIVIDIGSQQARFYKGGELVGASPISSGNSNNPTPVGGFSVIQKDEDHRSNLYGDYVDTAGNVVVQNVDVGRDRKPAGAIFRGAPMPYFMRFYGGAGMHAGFLPGFPDSHGCVRLPERMAAIFFANAPSGTPVRVMH